MTKESQTYQSMLQEVEQIVDKVGDQSLDLDAMVSEVEKGYQLIKKMRSRLDETKGKIEKLRLEYDQPEE